MHAYIILAKFDQLCQSSSTTNIPFKVPEWPEGSVRTQYWALSIEPRRLEALALLYSTRCPEALVSKTPIIAELAGSELGKHPTIDFMNLGTDYEQRQTQR